MSRTYRLLDAFCGAGGCSMGYSRAGFEVVGVDRAKQPRYPFESHQGDALEFIAEHGHEFDAIHASPPCQCYTALKRLARKGHADLLAPTRQLLERLGKPYVIENVPGAPIRAQIMLCGTMFGLRTPCGAELRRHRYFEINWPLSDFVPECRHGERTVGIFGDHARDSQLERERYRGVISVHGDKARDRSVGRRTVSITGHQAQVWPSFKSRTVTVTGSTPQQNVVRNTIRETFSVADARIAMGIDWMSMKGLSQAIPPAYTEWIGKRLIEHLQEQP